MLKKAKTLNSKIMKNQMKSLSTIYADFESTLVPEDNEQQNSEESYTNKYQKHIAYSYGYKLCVDNTFI